VGDCLDRPEERRASLVKPSSSCSVRNLEGLEGLETLDKSALDHALVRLTSESPAARVQALS
jgi:hypothetical protein